MYDSPALKGIKVVFQVTNSITAMMLHRALTQASCRFVLPSRNGCETAEILRHTRVDLILLEVEAYEAGMRTIAQMAKDANACLVIISGDSRNIAEEQARSLGADGFLCKPVTLDCLVPALERALQAFHAGPPPRPAIDNDHLPSFFENAAEDGQSERR